MDLAYNQGGGHGVAVAQTQLNIDSLNCGKGSDANCYLVGSTAAITDPVKEFAG